jgi:hypothetical protein
VDDRQRFVNASRLNKKKGKPNIAPLQPPTLATFRSWGDSAGAGRAGLLGAKIQREWDKWANVLKKIGFQCFWNNCRALLLLLARSHIHQHFTSPAIL